MTLDELDTEYGPFRLVRGSEVLRSGGMTESEVTRLAEEIAGTEIQHQNPKTGVWSRW